MNKEFLVVNGDVAFYDSVKALEPLARKAQATKWISELSALGIITLYIVTKVNEKICYYRQSVNSDGIEAITETAFKAEFTYPDEAFCEKDEFCENSDGVLPSINENALVESSTAQTETAVIVELPICTQLPIEVADGQLLKTQPVPPIIDYEKIRQIFTEELEKFFKQKLG